jgi:PAS domain S-box-containing protein
MSQPVETDGYRELFEHAPLGYQSLDPDGRLVQVNRAWCAMLGYEREEVLGRPFTDFLLPEAVSDFHCRFELVKEQGEVHGVEFPIRRKDGQELLASLEGRAIYRDDGALERTYAILTDLTERRRAETRLRDMMLNTVRALARTLEKRDPYTAGHQERVGALAALIAARLGMDAALQEGIRLGGTIHDIGKIYVPVEILTRPGKLTELEMNYVRTHPVVGYEIIKDIDFAWPIAEMVRQHHERLDGSGYPRGLGGSEIILGARILAVADVIEAIASMRPYRPGLGIDVALHELRQGKGRIYDADVVAITLDLFADPQSRLAIERDIFDLSPSGDSAS